MLKLRTVLHKKINRQGFTLAELLVVVAIIAILVAVSIPIFSGKLTEARRSVDLANERAARAVAVMEYINKDRAEKMYYDAENGVLQETAVGIEGYNQLTTGGGTIKPEKGIIVVGLGGYKDKPKVYTYWDDATPK